MTLTREEKEKSLAKWEWELKLLESDMAGDGNPGSVTGPEMRRIPIETLEYDHFMAVARHAAIVRALVRQAKRELEAS